MAKTFYEVTCLSEFQGTPGCRYSMWFSNRSLAYAFYLSYGDGKKPRPHHFRSPKSILRADLLVSQSEEFIRERFTQR